MSRRLPQDQRRKLDAYYTPDGVASACLGAMLHRVGASDTMLEPSVGGGAFVRALRFQRPFAPIHGCDLNPGAEGLAACDTSSVGDFLDTSARYDWIIGNPPYAQAEAHVRHAIRLANKGVGFLLRLAFLEGRGRRSFWSELPASELHVLSRRPSFTDGGTDATAYAFFVWLCDGQRETPRVFWLDGGCT